MSHVPYDKWTYLYPPRTEAKLPFDLSSPVLQAWEKARDAIAQYKLNGSRNLIVIDPQDNITFWNRHKEQQRNYQPPTGLLSQIRALQYPHGAWNIIDSELMHFKTQTIKNSVYVFDVLVWNNEYLVGDKYEQRFNLVKSLGISDFFPLDNTSHDGKIWIAENMLAPKWEAAWNAALKIDAVEGLVLKRAGAVSKLQFAGNSVVNNSGFMCRVRKPFKNSQF